MKWTPSVCELNLLSFDSLSLWSNVSFRWKIKWRMRRSHTGISAHGALLIWFSSQKQYDKFQCLIVTSPLLCLHQHAPPVHSDWFERWFVPAAVSHFSIQLFALFLHTSLMWASRSLESSASPSKSTAGLPSMKESVFHLLSMHITRCTIHNLWSDECLTTL